MNIFKLSLHNLRFHALATFFNVVVLALGIATIVTLLHISQQVEDSFQRDLEGIDLVVGAKGSPIQLILSSVFHLDVPNGNIPLEEAEKLEHDPMVKAAIPVALGDNYRGFRIVGTTPDYPKHYNAQLAQGAYWTKNMQAVLGSEVARVSGLKVGGSFVGAHGLVDSSDVHEKFPYEVTGILAPTGTVIDRLVFTDVGSVWNVHEHPDADDEHPAHHGREITSLLITYASDYAAVKLPYLVNKSSSMQAASPAVEMHRLLAILGVGSETVQFFGEALMLIAGIGFFVTLWSAVSDRSYEIALVRSLGATRAKIFGIVLAEGVTLGIMGTALGIALGHVFAVVVQHTIEASRHMTLETVEFHAYELHIVVVALAISVIVSIIPAIMAYRVNVSAVLSKGA